MENATDANSITDPSKYYKANDPTYPCNILDQRYQKICYTYGVLSLYQNNIPKAIQLCSTIPQQFSDDCFQTFGRDRTMISDDPANLYSQCGQVKDESYRTECLKGLSYNLVVRFGLQSPLAAEFCALVDQQNKPTCYVRIEEGAEAETRDESKLMSFCNTITESSYKDSCKQYFQPPQQ